MFYKYRTKSNELIVLELLNRRMSLTNKVKQHYYSQKKGYEGEVMFDSFTKKLHCECLILNDLLFEIKNTTFQIDSLIITAAMIYFYEVKNFEGDYYYDSDKLFKKPELEVINPLHQLSRSESLLRQLFLNIGYNLPINAFIVFINPIFTLYQAPLDKPIIFPTQVKQHMTTLNKIPSKLTEKHKRMADHLLSLHITDSPYKQIPKYDYRQLRKGITCAKCHSFSVTLESRKLVCHECKNEELVADAVIRSVNEFRILFPNKRITTNIIHEWCQIIPSQKRIRRIISSNFNKVGDHRWSYYE